MKILFLISILGHGRGGHVHSLDHISREIGKWESIHIITIGPGRSEILESSPYFLQHINFHGLNILKLRKKIKNVLSQISPDILHCFDERAYNLLKILALGGRYKYVLNKCGGPNPLSYPKAENLVLFSRENKAWFESKPQFSKTVIYLIPNRVERIRTSFHAPFLKDTNSFTFVRIARISRFHKQSIITAINLINRLLVEDLKNVRLVIVGAVQDQEVYDELRQEAVGKPVDFIIDSKYTVKASEMLYLADAVIGTGRGAMEAASLSLPVLSPASNSDVPIVLTKDNIDNFLSYNFSPRTIVSDADLLHNWSLVLEMVKKGPVYEDVKNQMAFFFDAYFSIERCYEKYKAVYENALVNKETVSSLADLKSRLKTLYSFYINKNYGLK